ncbi:MAG: type 1 glutamine amidotransferase [Pseudomonadota bacterium]
MRLIIAETGTPPSALPGDWPSYPQMFAAMFERAKLDFDIETINVIQGALVPEPQRGVGLLVTGSPKGVYEDHAFIAPLEAAVRDYAEAGCPVVGICFGHQLIARAYGAEVAKSERGWGVGVHTYEIVGETPWQGGPSRFACAVSHQDQVLSLPEGFRRVAGSAFTPYGALAHDSLPLLSFQMHPEFDHDFAAALMQLRADRIPADRVDLGQATLRNTSDRAQMAHWIGDFIKNGGR